MRNVLVKLEGLAPYTQSRFHGAQKMDGELPDAYEERTWKEKAHVTPDGNIFIPAIAIQTCIKEAAKFLNKKIPGKRNETWTKHFEAGVLVMHPLVLSTKIVDARKLSIYVPADGTPGGKKRVMRHFPTVDTWGGGVEILILDDMITKEILLEVLELAGNLIGLGSFRVRNRSTHGRFKVVSLK